jgi:hypothetical protein
LDAAEVIPNPLASHLSRPARFSDLFRFAALTTHPGWIWVDADTLLLKPWEIAQGYVFGKEGEKYVPGTLSLPSDSDVLSYLNLQAQAKIGGKSSWGDIGPELFNNGVKKFNLEAFSQAEETFYPIEFLKIDALFNPKKFEEVTQKIQFSQSVHLYNEIQSRIGIEKSLVPQTGSFLYYQFLKYGLLDTNKPQAGKGTTRVLIRKARTYRVLFIMYKKSAFLKPFLRKIRGKITK